ncbi:MAG: hypothetical protein KBE91_00600 [Bacteroidia bacterium]|nr:hypothetical protein [Bacteroidia bacterium]
MAKFDRYPGVAQRVFPEQLRGVYYFILPSNIIGKKGESADTIFYTITDTAIVLKDSIKTQTKPLNSQQVLSLLHDKYFVLSTIDEEDAGYWNCMFFVPSKKGLTIHPAIDELKTTDLKKQFKHKFVRLNNNNDSVFVYEMHDANFVRYYKKMIKKNHTLKLNKLTSKTQ